MRGPLYREIGARVTRADRDGRVAPGSAVVAGPCVHSAFCMERDRIALRATGDREKLLDRAKGSLDCDSDAEVINTALRHAVESVENFEDVNCEVSPELAERLSADEVRPTQYPHVRVD